MSIKTVDEWGVIHYKNEKGELDREDGPALLYDNFKAWYINGKLHREDGPAWINGDFKVWWFNGERHREDGPAIEYPNGDVEYWLSGELYTEEEFELEMVVKKKLQKIKDL